MNRQLSRLVWLAAGVVCVFLLGWWMLRPQAVAVDLGRVQRGSMQLTVHDDGRTRIREKYTVSTPVAGRLIRIDLKPGDEVFAGETVLAVIEPTDPALLDPRSLAEAQARQKAAEARLSRVAPQLEIAEQQLAFTQSELQRLRKLSESNAISQQDLEEAILAQRSAEAERTSATFAREIAEYELRMAQAALVHTTQPPDYAGGESFRFPIQSPITGKILRVSQESATIVQPGEPLMEIGDPADLEIELDVLSTDAVKVRPGAKVLVDHWGGDTALTGRVRLIEPAAFTKVSALGIEEQRVNIIIDFDSDQNHMVLGDGYRVEAAIIVWEGPDVLKVPIGATFRRGKQWAVFVNDAGRARQKTVVLGHRNDLEAEVIEGLSENDQVVLHPGDRVSQDARLRERNL